jgi:colanic acid/amylovoran biosynthesis glycosyltransferase
MRFGYLVSQYPAISHTFILREVEILRRLGLDIEPSSINVPDRPAGKLTASERDEAARTYYVLASSRIRIAFIIMASLARSPGRFAAALFFGLRLAGSDLRRSLYCCFYFLEAVLIADWMRRKSINHLHVHFGTPAATVALILTRFARVTFSITIHGPDEFYDVPGYYLAEKVKAARFICAIGSYTRSQLMRISDPRDWNKIEVAPLGVDPAVFAPRPFRSSPPVFEILCVGRLVPAKGQHILLRAASRLLASGKNLLVRFVGVGPDAESLRQETQRLRLDDHVVFEGAVNQDRIRTFYESADVFCLPSFAEGIPVVLMEAMAMEVPCITTWITGIPELIRNEVDGLLVAASDLDGLACAIARLADDPVLRERIGKAGRQRVLDRYQLYPNACRLAEIFERRLGAHA